MSPENKRCVRCGEYFPKDVEGELCNSCENVIVELYLLNEIQKGKVETLEDAVQFIGRKKSWKHKKTR